MSDAPRIPTPPPTEHTVNVLKAERAVLISVINALIEEASYLRAHGGQLPPGKGPTAVDLAVRTVAEVKRHG